MAHESVCVSISELAGGFHGGLDDEYRESLMELLFNVAATTKVRRVLLNLWFNLDGRTRDGQSGSEVSSDVSSLPFFWPWVDVRTISRSFMLCWRTSLLKGEQEISQRRGCCTLSSWQKMEMNWKNGSSQVI